VYLLVGVGAAVLLWVVRRTARRRARSGPVGWVADYTPDAPSRPRDPGTGRADRGWL
jgi:hypothetical protein